MSLTTTASPVYRQARIRRGADGVVAAYIHDLSAGTRRRRPAAAQWAPGKRNPKALAHHLVQVILRQPLGERSKLRAASADPV